MSEIRNGSLLGEPFNEQILQLSFALDCTISRVDATTPSIMTIHTMEAEGLSFVRSGSMIQMSL